MDRNNIIGFVLLAVLFIVWMTVNNKARKEAELERIKKDSITLVNKPIDSSTKEKNIEIAIDSNTVTKVDSHIIVNTEIETLENELVKIEVSSKGGKIVNVFLKNFKSSGEDAEFRETRGPLHLMNAPQNNFEYIIGESSGSTLNTGAINGIIIKEGNAIISRIPLNGGGVLEQKYILSPGKYEIEYQSKITGLKGLTKSDLKWVNHITKLERNWEYEKTYSTIYYKLSNESPDYLSYTKDDSEDFKSGQNLQWISSLNQFFNVTFIPEVPFSSGRLSVQVNDGNDYLKVTSAEVSLPESFRQGQNFSMKIYAGPNDFKILRGMGNDLEDLVQFGSSIMGSINRWVMRPIFIFLLDFISTKGIVILLLTLFVKLCLFPLTYRMIYSQSKMAALKPEIDKLKAKYGDDQQKMQMETMSMYREFGVNPLGGCLPMLLQMPIWFALYRFFPASIEFRQSSFLWATDLSSFDDIIHFPFAVPLLGHHLSLLTILWTVTTLLYTWYNFKNVDTTSAATMNPAMKYMQYIMPVIFLFFFNKFASGLTLYLVFSNLLNIAQTIFTKSFLINNDKILSELQKNKAKPKKAGGFSERMANMMKEQQRLAEERNKKLKK